MTENVNIIQWNAQGLTTSKEDLLKLIEDYEPTVIAIQETFLANNFSIPIKEYTPYCKQGSFNRRFHGGVATYVHNSLVQEPIEITSDIEVVGTKITLQNNKHLNLLNIYAPGSRNICRTDLENILDQVDEPIMFLGDFNAHHTSWGNTRCDSRGNFMETFMRDRNLNLLNDGQPTHISGTAIDLSIISPALNSDIYWNVIESPFNSDHFPIVISFSQENPTNSLSKEKYNHWKGNWTSFKTDPIWQNLPEIHPDDPKKTVQDLYKILDDLTEKYVPKYKVRRFYPKPWWSKECLSAWKEREKKYKKFKRTRLDEDRVQWKRARASARRIFKKHKSDHWNQFIESLKARENSGVVWRKMRSIKGKPQQPVPVLREGSTVYKTIDEVAEKLATSFQDTASNSNYSNQFIQHKNIEESNPINFQSDNHEAYNKLFNIEELIYTIGKLKNNSPGPDEISNMLLKQIPAEGIEYILRVVNLVWDKTYFDDKWRHAWVVPTYTQTTKECIKPKKP